MRISKKEHMQRWKELAERLLNLWHKRSNDPDNWSLKDEQEFKDITITLDRLKRDIGKKPRYSI
jgi:hypothetical protein